MLLSGYRLMLRVCDYLIAAILACELVLISYNVLARFLFNSSSGALDEISQSSLLWLVTLGSVVLMDRYGLFFAEVLHLFVKNRRLRIGIVLLDLALLLVFFATVLWTGIQYVEMTAGFEMDYSPLNRYWFYAAMPVWGALMCVVVIKKMIFLEEPDFIEAATDD